MDKLINPSGGSDCFLLFDLLRWRSVFADFDFDAYGAAFDDRVNIGCTFAGGASDPFVPDLAALNVYAVRVVAVPI